MANVGRPRHLITTKIEHHAVLEPMETLAQNGCEVDIVPVEPDGRIDPAEIRRRLRKDTLLVSVMHANNEIGTIQPIMEIGGICREAGVADQGHRQLSGVYQQDLLPARVGSG